MGHSMIYSWTAKTLIMMGSGGPQTEDHPHAAFVWVSKDNGETWTDETGTLGRPAQICTAHTRVLCPSASHPVKLY